MNIQEIEKCVEILLSKSVFACPQFKSLESFSVDDVGLAPRISGIYFVLTPCGEVWYVGRSKNINSRWKNHHRMSQCQAAYIEEVAYIEVSEEDLRFAESEFIRLLKPCWNGSHPVDGNGEHRIRPRVDASRWHSLKKPDESDTQALARLSEAIVDLRIMRVRTKDAENQMEAVAIATAGLTDLFKKI